MDRQGRGVQEPGPGITLSPREKGVYFVREDSGEQTWTVGERYKLIKILGSGSFSCVCLAQDLATGGQVALKRIGDVLNSLDNAKRVLREVCILRRLTHPNIIQLLDVFLRPSCTGRFVYRGGKLVPTSVDIYMALEYCNHGDLFHMRGQMTELEVKHIVWQLLGVLRYVHANNVWHRDIKSANILVHLEEGRRTAKLCDFGSARAALTETSGRLDTWRSGQVQLGDAAGSGPVSMDGQHRYYSSSSQDFQGPPSTSTTTTSTNPPAKRKPLTGFEVPLTRVVCTPCYRAPEVVMSRGGYNSAIDMWSLGCVFGELLQRVAYLGKAATPNLQVAPVIAVTGMPTTPAEGDTFAGPGNSNTRHELNALFDVVGTPSWACIESVPSEPWRKYLKKIAGRAPKLYRRFGMAGEVPVDLLSRMLTFDPLRRCSAEEAMAHEYFKEFVELQSHSEDDDMVVDSTVDDHAARGMPQSMDLGTPNAATAAAITTTTVTTVTATGIAQQPAAAAAAASPLHQNGHPQGSPAQALSPASPEEQAQAGSSSHQQQRPPRFYEIEDPAQALAVLEEELAPIGVTGDNGGCDQLREMLERECLEHAQVQRDEAMRESRDGIQRRDTRTSHEPYYVYWGMPHGYHELISESYKAWEKLKLDPGAHMDPSLIGLERISHHADSEQAQLDASKHLRAGRHGEWASTSLGTVQRNNGTAWGVTLVPPGMEEQGMDPGLMEAIRQQHAR